MPTFYYEIVRNKWFKTTKCPPDGEHGKVAQQARGEGGATGPRVEGGHVLHASHFLQGQLGAVVPGTIRDLTHFFPPLRFRN